MKAQTVFLALAATSCSAFPLQSIFKNKEDPSPLRLVKLGPNEYKSLSDDELLQLKREGKNFIDVTSTIATLAEHDLSEPEQPPLPQVPIPSKVHFTDSVKDVLPLLDITSMEDNLYNLTSFFTRWYKSKSGLASSLWLLGQVMEIADFNKSLDIDVFAWDNPWPQKSVIARFVGTGAKANGESKKKKKAKHTDPTIVIGAHQDSINLLFPSLMAAPGADDDGSGTVTILEAFKALVLGGFQPINTVEFHWYSGEEDGLLGSQRIFSEYFKRRINVGAMLQQDMTGFVKGTLDKGKPESIGIVTDYVDGNLTDFIKSCVDEYCDIPWVDTECGYACSDHASASEFGYRSAFAIESEFDLSSPFIHSTSDTVDRLSFDHMLQHAKLTLGYAYELGNTNFTELAA